jgi:hypothetical protein
MKRAPIIIWLIVTGGTLLLAGCGGGEERADELSSIGNTPAERDEEQATEESGSPTTRPNTPPSIWRPEPGATWQWQLQGELNTSWDVEMYDVDLFNTPAAVIEQLRADGRTVICYFSAGSHEDWRPDADRFPAEVIGAQLDEWPGERWVDIREIEALAPIMLARLDLAVESGCHGVEPDNIDGFSNRTGFPLSAEDQVTYNRWLAEAAHARGLSIGLKNALDLIPALVDDFDWALNEQCFQYEECEALLPFIAQGKAVFGVEYEGEPADYCSQALALGFSWLTKTYDLADEPPGACQ